MMLVLARRCHTRYSYRMTDFKPLEYIASLVVFSVIITYVAAFQWSKVVHDRSKAILWLSWMAALRTLGFLIGILAWTGAQAIWLPHLLVLLWSKRAGDATNALRHLLAQYCERRAFHRPQHAK